MSISNVNIRNVLSLPYSVKSALNAIFEELGKNLNKKIVYQYQPVAILVTHQVKGGESSNQFRWFTVAKIEL